MPQISPKVISAQLSGVPAVSLTRDVYDDLMQLAVAQNCRRDTLIALIVFVQLHAGSPLTADELLEGVGADKAEATAAWRALQMGGWLDRRADSIVIHLPQKSPIEGLIPSAEWQNPLHPLAAAWAKFGGQPVTAFALKRVYTLLSQSSTVELPYRYELACEFYRAALPDHSFDDIARDLQEAQEQIQAAAVAWDGMGRPDVQDVLAAAWSMESLWLQIRGRVAEDRTRLFRFMHASLAGVSLETFEKHARAYEFLYDAIRASIDDVRNALAYEPLNIRNLLAHGLEKTDV